MKYALEKTKRIANACQAEDAVQFDENGDVISIADSEDHDYDITELIADNRILLDRVDNMLEGDDCALSTRRSIQDSAEVESLTSSLVDGLFKQIKATEKKEKKNQGAPQQKSRTNLVSSKK